MWNVAKFRQAESGGDNEDDEAMNGNEGVGAVVYAADAPPRALLLPATSGARDRAFLFGVIDTHGAAQLYQHKTKSRKPPSTQPVSRVVPAEGDSALLAGRVVLDSNTDATLLLAGGPNTRPCFHSAVLQAPPARRLTARLTLPRTTTPADAHQSGKGSAQPTAPARDIDAAALPLPRDHALADLMSLAIMEEPYASTFVLFCTRKNTHI